MLKKVLVVDDSALIHQMYRLVMSRYNCAIADAMNGQEALDWLVPVAASFEVASGSSPTRSTAAIAPH